MDRDPATARTIGITGLVLLFGLGTAVAGMALTPFGTVSVDPDFELDGAGTNVDSPAFWVAPDPADSLLFVAAKGNQRVEVWQHPFVGNELPALTHPSFGTGTQVNGVAVDATTDRLFVSTSAPASTVSVFSLPGLAFLGEIVAGAVSLGPEPNLALLALPGGGMDLFVSNETDVFRYDTDSGASLGTFTPSAGLETIVADPFRQALYIPDENGGSGVYAYDPTGAPFLNGGTNQFGGGGIFDDDAEGIIVFACPGDGTNDAGTGWIVVSDQKPSKTDFEVFDRVTWSHLGTLRIKDVDLTDGIASTQAALPGYPEGLFVAIDEDTSTSGVGWDVIRTATGLACDPVCSDGFDNDGDGATDYPNDPGCRDAAWSFEAPKCDDGVDNDGDGRTDWDGGAGGLPDPDCVTRPWRNQEGPGSCGLGHELALLVPLLTRLRRRRS